MYNQPPKSPLIRGTLATSRIGRCPLIFRIHYSVTDSPDKIEQADKLQDLLRKSADWQYSDRAEQ